MDRKSGIPGFGGQRDINEVMPKREGAACADQISSFSGEDYEATTSP